MHIADALSLSSLASVPYAAPATFQEFIKITSTVQYFMILRQSFERSSTACKTWVRVLLPSFCLPSAVGCLCERQVRSFVQLSTRKFNYVVCCCVFAAPAAAGKADFTRRLLSQLEDNNTSNKQCKLIDCNIPCSPMNITNANWRNN